MMKTAPWMILFFLVKVFRYHACNGEARIVCPRVQSTDMSMRLQAEDPNKADFTEISGLGFSSTLVGPSGQPILYAVNDSGGGRRMGIFDSGSGARLKSLRMPRSLPEALDYESMTVGSCGVDDETLTCIYIADVGDNTARDSGGSQSDRDAYPIYKIQEPNLDEFGDNDILPDEYVTTLLFNYLHPTSPTPYADCEATFLDNVGWGGGAVGDFYIVTKWASSDSDTLNRLFKIPADIWIQAKDDADFVYSPEAVGSYGNGRSSNGLMGFMWTRAEMTLDGSVIALGDYDYQYLYLRCPDMSVADALVVEGTVDCESWPVEYGNSQFETIAWTPDGALTLQISECEDGSLCGDSPMVWTTMNYTYDPDFSMACLESTTTAPTVAPSSSPVPPPTTVTPSGTPPPQTTVAPTEPPRPLPSMTLPPPTLASTSGCGSALVSTLLLFKITFGGMILATSFA